MSCSLSKSDVQPRAVAVELLGAVSAADYSQHIEQTTVIASLQHVSLHADIRAVAARIVAYSSVAASAEPN